MPDLALSVILDFCETLLGVFLSRFSEVAVFHDARCHRLGVCSYDGRSGRGAPDPLGRSDCPCLAKEHSSALDYPRIRVCGTVVVLWNRNSSIIKTLSLSPAPPRTSKDGSLRRIRTYMKNVTAGDRAVCVYSDMPENLLWREWDVARCRSIEPEEVRGESVVIR